VVDAAVFEQQKSLEKLMISKLAIVAVLIGLSASTSVRAEAWTCTFDGNWTRYNSSERGEFMWNVLWTSSGRSGWKITGDYSDDYGDSILDGDCNDRSCTLTQIYQNGQLAGNRYTWKGNYSDESVGGGRTINRFDGTWGESSSARDGAWRATAICNRD
jgi:hypothetical protein